MILAVQTQSEEDQYVALSLTHQLLILEHTEGPKTLVTFETFDQIDETDQQKDNDKGPFTYYVSRRRGEGGKPKADH